MCFEDERISGHQGPGTPYVRSYHVIGCAQLDTRSITSQSGLSKSAIERQHSLHLILGLVLAKGYASRTTQILSSMERVLRACTSHCNFHLGIRTDFSQSPDLKNHMCLPMTSPNRVASQRFEKILLVFRPAEPRAPNLRTVPGPF